VTLRNFAGSYFEKDRLITVQYRRSEVRCRKITAFSDSDLRHRRSASWAALRGLQDLREGMPATVHLYY